MRHEPPEELRRLQQRLSNVSDAAERLIAEAARSAERQRPPPQGWQSGPSVQEPSRHPSSELELVLRALGAMRDLVPPEVAERLAASLRELLLALRALIDVYLERLERQAAEPGDDDVQDIPIA